MSCEFEPFQEYLVRLGRSERTVAGYLIDIRTFSYWFEQTNGYPLTPDNLTPTDVREYRQFLLNVRKAKASTINRHLAVLRAYGLWAKNSGSIQYNPVEGIKSIAQQKHAPKWLDRREQAALAKSGEIAQRNRSMPHSGEREKAGQKYCTSSVRHGPVSA